MLLKTEELTRSMLIKWAVSLVIAVGAYYVIPRSETLTDPMVAFLAVTLWAVCAWAMDTLNGTMVGLLLPMLYIVVCHVPQKVVFAPWLGEVAIISIAGFTLGKIVQSTGLGKRIALSCVQKMGGSFAGALAGFTVGAAIVSPFVPSIMGKAAIFLAISISLCDALDFKAGSREATAIVLGTCMAVGGTKLAYLTGAGDLVMGMGLVDKVLGTQTSWVQYAIFNFPPAMIYTALGLVLVLLVLRSSADKATLRRVAQEKYSELGVVSDDEKRAAILFVLTLVMLATESIHHLSTGTTLMFIMGLSFMPGVGLMDAKKLGQTNFSPLFFIMGCMSIGAAGGFLKVTQWLANQVMPLFTDAGASMASVCAYGVGVLLNFLLTPLAATSTLSVPIAELASSIGLDPRLLYFSFQYGLDNLIFPYEYALYLFFYSSGYINFKDMALVMFLRIIMSGLFIACIAVPWWNLML
ncbi:MAG: anion permease [Desulfovibrionaceae bacterium]|nr:anion permease [Desulfovibrionaceae bacterium]